jgi:hypothetical protein
MMITVIDTGYIGLVTGAAIKTKAVFDGRKVYRRVIVWEAGFDYYAIEMGENIAEKA